MKHRYHNITQKLITQAITPVLVNMLEIDLDKFGDAVLS